MSNQQVFGGVLCEEPFIFLGKRMPAMDNDLGLMSFRPDLFRDRPSLSLLTLGHTYEPDYMIRALVRDMDEARREFPLAQFVMLANTPREDELFREAGLRSLLASELMFGNIANYRLPEFRSEKRFDAVYVGRLAPEKRHELAAKVPSLLCLYFRATHEELDTCRALLPHAVFGNHDFNDDEYRLLLGEDYLEAVDSACVGLCLSAAEGAMRASIEYQLCGLPVVSTPSLGGRDRYLHHKYARIVDATPEAVAAATAELKAAQFDPAEIRANAVRLLEEDRAKFLEDLRVILAESFGSDAPRIDSFDLLEAAKTQMTRPVPDVLIPVLGRVA
ncbi:hypothetical protein SAMN06297129_1682 [Pseudooceanicola antarcticus]|uniref:Glycosyl transferases group 1 n=1 Tax=Pseudooceanicola antarcticus TaxID=1247613 RepID=A0A285IQG9_9RHOB|nr:glycosyltransferase [Pseudooceanicola antarcticus]PJE31412.1 hypothetical protein CVM39_03395 [Pseudooceanicola antarcticus]SNY50093.1 hypothetical protein SAMN06297129_1682 [Pseudooceanicola antarcticus]